MALGRTNPQLRLDRSLLSLICSLHKLRGTGSGNHAQDLTNSALLVVPEVFSSMKCPNCRVRSGRKTSQICLILAPFLTNPFPSEEFLGQRDDDARRASHVAESVLVLVLGHLADEFGAIGAQASDSVVDAFDPESKAARSLPPL